MPMRRVSRLASSALRSFWDLVSAYLCGGSDTFGALGLRQTALAATSTKFGLADLTESRPFLMTFMSLTSSTNPFSHELPTIRRLTPGRMGIFDLRGGSISTKPFDTL